MNLTADILQLVKSRPLLTELKNSDDPTSDYVVKSKPISLGKIGVPETFDGKTIWKHLLTPVSHQGSCGACWAFASSSTLADRFNIQTNGKLKINLSPANMVLCSFRGNESKLEHPDVSISEKINIEGNETGSCHGNTLYDAWRYLYVYGTCERDCIPYKLSIGSDLGDIKDDSIIPLCSTVSGPLRDMCQDFYIDTTTKLEYGTPKRHFRAKHFYGIENNIDIIKHEIYRWGPVSAGFKVYPDFYTFNAKTNIYKWNKKGPSVGGHAVVIVGWGKDYWIIRNTWSEKWGKDGYFYMGFDECELQDNIIACVPDYFFDVSKEEDVYKNTWAEKEPYITERKNIDLGEGGVKCGGINPINGYTRRIEITKPYLDLSKYIKFNIDYMKDSLFACGKLGNYKNYKNYKNYLYVILIIFIIFIFYKIFNKKWKYKI